MNNMNSYTYFQSPASASIGTLRLRASDSALLTVDHVNQQQPLSNTWKESPDHPILTQAITELEEYFAGKRYTFDTPLAPVGTKFQLSVWSALQSIPYGKTCSYADIAEKINNPKAVRAVGTANGSNPLSIFIPCHRVIGKNGTLTGYAGGLDAKTTLLRLEGHDEARDLFS